MKINEWYWQISNRGCVRKESLWNHGKDIKLKRKVWVNDEKLK